VKADKLRRHYKTDISGFTDWIQKKHAEDYLIFPQNIGPYLSIDEVALSQGELYTFVTNKNGRGKSGTLVASIKGTRSEDIIEVLQRLDLPSRKTVKEVTLDMAKNMESAIKMSFPDTCVVTDRFHVVKLVIEALQHIRIKYRWIAIDQENELIKQANEQGVKYKSKLFENNDSPKQLLARSRHLLSKSSDKWTVDQQQRAAILFREYPEIEMAYQHTIRFRNIYETKSRQKAQTQLKDWISQTADLNIKEFNSTARSITYHLENILNFFENRSTNANAESFNSKIKLFRANLRGVTDTCFFLFRLQKLFA
jgi:transposase